MPPDTWVRAGSLREIECFLAVADHLHFRQAAESLHIPQPHLSRTIRRLEQRLGADLFVRTSRHVELTPVGVVFVEEARALWAAAERTSRRVQLASSGAAGALLLGFTPWAVFHGMPEHVTTFKARFPDVEVELFEDAPLPLCEKVRSHALDVAYVRPIERPGLRFHNLAAEPYSVVVRRDHPWAALSCVPLQYLHGEPFVLISGSTNGPKSYDGLIEPLAAAGIEPKVILKAPSAVAAVAFVRAGAGFTLATSAHRVLAPDLVCVPLERTEPTVQLAIAVRRGDISPIIAAYLKHVEGCVTPQTHR
jgi:DNA-binding transcriptional LysR family regulator